MVISARLKVYGIVLGVFLLGALAGGASGYAMAGKRLTEMLSVGRPGLGDSRRLEALSRELDLSRDQRRRVRGILERSRDENRRLTQAMFEKCGSDVQALRSRVDTEIRSVLNEAQAKRFGELVAERGQRFPFGAKEPASAPER